MSASLRSHARRPVLLLMVYGMFLVLVGVTASAQAGLVSAHFSTTMLNSIVGNDSATVRSFVNSTLTPEDLTGAGLAAARADHLEEQLATLVARGEILRAEIRTPDGTILVSDIPVLRGTRAADTQAFSSAAAGEASAAILDSGQPSEATGPGLHSPSVMREFLPIIADGETQAVFALWRDARPILAQLDAMRGDVVLVIITAALIAAALLHLIFRSAQGRITRQTAQLLEATRKDPLTGLLNHGALVGVLAEVMEAAREDGDTITVALVDIDNFRLLNDTHGHGAGDGALLEVGKLLIREAPAQAICGRYGPDEFLIIAPGTSATLLEPAVERLRSAMAEISLQFGTSESLPVTVSVGLCSFPRHAQSVTGLLSTAALTLAEAQSSGGDAVRVADTVAVARAENTTFDVLQGLVFAVDTKDRYTKRHSEDVARYALFLADQLGLDAELKRSVRISGLLHDVGKIGLPDNLLRRPGRLTRDEQAVVEQHVALGDMIVRDLPNIELIRAGIRHHHERWDGTGYLDRLEGEEIPLIARVLAVGDAFSAMTTSRPYRKALPIEEALRRLGDASGTQLDESLVRAFIRGIETAPDAPLPGRNVATGRFWTPDRQVA
ncbi:hypothetical protein BH20CHL6_BH20CHL6_06140 [soil metagenome]